MSLEVQAITKKYGPQTVLDQISFSAVKGEILGFLGPNGAGKTTTMKLVTGYILPDSGQITVCGIDALNFPLTIKRSIGYLPEHNPLYGNMYVKEYLGFICRLHGMKQFAGRVNEMIDQTGLDKEQHKQIKMLSKGYRQRVGLAQALIHDPEVLILDEPTSGLDPNQLEDIRQLIRTMGKEKTVVFSTHIMQEVQALCDRVIILNEGKIVADDRIEQLEKYLIKGHERISVEFELPVDPSIFESLPGFISLQSIDNCRYLIDCESERSMRKHVFELAGKSGLPLIGLQKQEVTIDTIFKALTHKS